MLAADRSRRFEEVLAAYLEARERGERVDPAALVRAHPEIAEELREFFANERQLVSAAAGLGVAAPSFRPAGSRVGEYEILGEIARGGMGIVYRASHARLRRVVALKMMLAGDYAGSEGLRRFRTEAEVVANLDHPNIVPVYDIGECDGHAYFTMKLIEGPSLKERVGEYAGKPEEAVRVIVAIARAVHHAHQRGVLHRDLKPGNILLSLREPARPKQDGYPVAGIPAHAQHHPKSVIPFVSDFGLAKRFGGDGWASQSSAVVGTAAYMAPEQATGKQALTVAADVYSLGAMLFELLTGRPPFVGQNQMEVLLQAVEKEAPSPLTLQPDLDPDLAQVCLKCLQKDPDERYESAEELAEDLENWLKGEALTVRAPGTLERFGRWCRRHPLAAFTVCMLMVSITLLAAGLVGANWYLSDLNQQLVDANQLAEDNKLLAENRAKEEAAARVDADKARLEAEKAKLELQQTLAKEKEAREAESLAQQRRRQLLVQQYLANAQEMTQRGEPGSALVWFAAALEQDQGTLERELPHRIRLGAALRQYPSLNQMWFLDGKPRLTRLGPKGDRLFLVPHDSAARLFDCATAQPIGEPMPVGASVHAEFSPDASQVAVAVDGTVSLIDVKTGTQRHVVKHPAAVNALAFSSDGRTLVTGSSDKTAHVWDADTGKPIGKALAHNQEVKLVALHPGGKKLLTFSETGKNKKGDVLLWDLTTSKEIHLAWPPTQAMLSAGFSRDGQRVHAISSTRKLFQWQITGQPLLPTMNLFVKGDQGPWFAPASDRLIQVAENEVRLLDLPKGSAAFTLPHDSPPYLARYGDGGRCVVTATANRGVRVWQIHKGEPRGDLLPHSGLVADVQMSRDDRWLATIGQDHCVRLWDLSPLKSEAFPALPKGKSMAAVAPDGTTALLTQAKAGMLWNFVDGRAVGTPLTMTTPIMQAMWANDGKTLAIATHEEARVFDARTGRPLSPSLRIDKLDDRPTHLHYTGGDVVLWNAAHAHAWDLTGNTLWHRKLIKQTQLLDCDGARLALRRPKGGFEIIDARSAKTRPLAKLAIVPELFRFAPDGRRGLAAFSDGSLRIWDLSTGRPTTLSFWHGAPVR
ncbi:MAG TPA: protein kinase, partial [Gemmataceae bacterium]|nr:protein kinase [Gemmataceae bacterium]